MKIKNPMLVVTDIDKSVEFYKKVFGLHVIMDFGANKTLTGGLALQTLETWQEFIGTDDISFGSNSSEVYFEEDNFDKDRFWVTFDKEDARSLFKGEKMYSVYYPSNRSIKALLINTWRALKILPKEKPDLIISSGAAPAIPFFWIGINSMRLHSNGHPLIVLSESNYMDYVVLPDSIIKRFNDGMTNQSGLSKCTLDRTKLSDIIRAYLLTNYGGVWADATMMFSGDLGDVFFENTWNSLGQDFEWYIGRGKWCTFLMSCLRGNGFCRFNYDMHVEYWENQEYWINYLMTDHIFDIAYKERPCFHKMVENVKCGNQKCLTVNRKYNQKCNIDEADEFFKAQILHKLSWKWGNIDKSDLCTEDGKDTWLGYLLKKYKR